jgi:hypothetical protein
LLRFVTTAEYKVWLVADCINLSLESSMDIAPAGHRRLQSRRSL